MGKKKDNFSVPRTEKSGRFESPRNLPDDNSKPVIFSFERIQSGKYCFSQLQKKDKQFVAEAIFKRKGLTREDLRQAPRMGLGTEKITLSCIRPRKPSFLTPDVEHVHSIRYCQKKPMVGYFLGNIFYILWFDHNFTVYDHGS